MAIIDLKAQKREVSTGSLIKSNRRKGNIPGVFYKGDENIPVFVKDVNLNHLVFTSEVSIINLQIDGAAGNYNCIIKDVQFDPVTDRPIHFDLLGISENEKIKIEVPIQLVGSAAGVKDGGVLQSPTHRVHVECLPKDIPSHIEVDVAPLKIGDAIHVSDLKHENYEIIEAQDMVIASVVPPTVEKVAEPAAEGEATAAAEPEVIAKGKKEEGEEEEKK